MQLLWFPFNRDNDEGSKDIFVAKSENHNSQNQTRRTKPMKGKDNAILIETTMARALWHFATPPSTLGSNMLLLFLSYILVLILTSNYLRLTADFHASILFSIILKYIITFYAVNEQLH